MRDVSVDDRGEGACKPAFNRRQERLAILEVFANALVDKNVRVHGDTDGQHDTGDTRQRQRRTQHRQDREDHDDVERHRDVGDEAEQPIEDHHEDDDENGAEGTCDDTALDRVGAETRADGTFFHHGELRRQRTGAQQNGKVVRRLDREAAGNLTRTTQDRLTNDRRGKNLVVKNDGKGLADILAGRLRKARRALGIEAEGDDRLVGLRVEARLCIDQILTRDERALFHQIGDRRVVLGIEHFRRRGGAAVQRILRRHGLVHHMEGQFCRLVQDVLQALRILQTGNLNDDAVSPFALDGRLGRAEFVHAAADDLSRLRDRRRHAVFDALVGDVDLQQAVTRIRQCRLDDRTARDRAGRNRLRQAGKRRLGGVNLAGVDDANLYGLPRAGKAGIADLRLAQLGAHIIHGRLQPFLDDVVAIHLQHDVRAALQVETQCDLVFREPGRKLRERLVTDRVRQRNEDADGDDKPDEDGLPTGIIEHGTLGLSEEKTRPVMPDGRNVTAWRLARP